MNVTLHNLEGEKKVSQSQMEVMTELNLIMTVWETYTGLPNGHNKQKQSSLFSQTFPHLICKQAFIENIMPLLLFIMRGAFYFKNQRNLRVW